MSFPRELIRGSLRGDERALKLSKPTLSIGYAAKHNALMADMGLSEFCQSARSLDVDRLIEQFKELESSSRQLRQTMLERNAEKARRLDYQFAELSKLLFPARGPVGATVEVSATVAPAHRGDDNK